MKVKRIPPSCYDFKEFRNRTFKGLGYCKSNSRSRTFSQRNWGLKMSCRTFIVAAVIGMGSIGSAVADPADTESFSFDPNSAIYSEFVMPSVDIFDFDPKSALYSEDKHVIVADAGKHRANAK